MKKINIILLSTFFLLAAVIIPVSCKKSFLNQTNNLQSTPEQTFQTSSDVIALVNSIYDTYQNSNLLKKSIWYFTNFETHDWFNFGGDVAWNNYSIPATFGQLPDFWNNSYIGIARANTAFSTIRAAKARSIITQELADRLTGECYYLRGMTYYYLAASFGGVPLELDTVLSNPTNGLTARSTQDSVFMQVVSDMKMAEGLLNSKTTLAAADLGRATKGAAYGYEGAAQMWLKNYTAALAAFNNPELTNNYHLMSNFVDVHEFDHQNNDESLFEVQFDLPDGGSQSWDGSWQPPGGEIAWIDDFSWPQEITDEGYDYGNPALWASYQQGDLRKKLTIIGPGDSIQSPGIIAAWGGIKGYPKVISKVQSGDPHFIGPDGKAINTCGTLTDPWYGQDQTTRTGYYCSKKWRDPSLTGGNGPSHIFGSQNQILLRYAEILLDRAECKVHTGDIPGAMADLKLVRNRAFGGTAPAVMQDSAKWDGTPGTPITDPLQMVLSEYRHELTGEYSVFYDLRRAGSNVIIDFIKNAYGTQANSYNPIPNPAPGPTHDGKTHGLYNTALTADRELLPIPQSQIALNPNIKQNPGY